MYLKAYIEDGVHSKAYREGARHMGEVDSWLTHMLFEGEWAIAAYLNGTKAHCPYVSRASYDPEDSPDPQVWLFDGDGKEVGPYPIEWDEIGGSCDMCAWLACSTSGTVGCGASGNITKLPENEVCWRFKGFD